MPMLPAARQVGAFAQHALRPLTTQAGGLKMNGAGSGLLFSAGVIGGVNLAGFAVTATFKTHKVTDLTGAGAFVLSAAACAWKSGSFARGAVRPMVLNIAVGAWGVRLASYLFARIMKTGEDERLASMFPDENEGWLDRKRSFFPLSLAGFWTVQAMWAWVVSLPVTLTNFSQLKAVPMGVGGWAFAGLFAASLAVESIADYQKFVFKNNPENKGKFVDTGLWAVSRHPNYLGEMGVWWAILGVALPALRGPAQVALGLASPAFITSLIMYVSGVPMLEKQHDKKYGDDPRYQEYKKNTPLLVPDVSSFF